ncbi:hypothetical protein SPRG_01645 [Saprolegnia parasitica CBS 223.65]|uniref:protein-histidine N-methyltransferase n=1 Tax=Saprolegnia parasitica (strain CBS 223.65) TaxID=695850 RepID=A0A067CSV3_SAPPC|nr:hypothetical protein SPRG_01645 [Saprolegnia parasitica CBS 223.65]KDO33764.1 hypothetical protein SPRG_01645 [Saprolegnia parasitica CBS 223.65]|eukprot:XP_012195402.1 hypothetical protein SPRG_01645 [Saprolegnia parasitica CBS 223.65]
MFRFNFDETAEASSAASAAAPLPMAKRPAKLHTESSLQVCDDYFMPVTVGGALLAVVNQQHPLFVQNTGALQKLLTTHDLETGVYEGGFKLWECSIDLIEYLQQHKADFPIGDRGLRVMELGCGHGLPGIFALQQGASHVLFSDYNSEVIELATIPNTLRCAGDRLQHASFYSGDWAHVSEAMAATGAIEDAYDLILTAETLYTEDVTSALLAMIKRHLKRSGVALVAAKTYYFGTGGSVHHFKDLVAREGDMVATTVWNGNDCRSNIREIVQVTYK